MLLHQPFADYYGAYRALEDLYEAGKVRAIGISNFYPDRMVDIASFARIRPMVNQVEVHPFHQQAEAKEWLDKYGIQMEAWAPFGEGRGGLFENPVLPDRCQIREDTSPGDAAVAPPAGRGGHSEIHPHRADAGESGRIRLRPND